MSILFRMISNLMIESATKFLDPASLFQGEPDESLSILANVISVLEFYKACFMEYRDKLPAFALPDKDPILWTFRPADIFDRLDQFMGRLYVIRDIFDIANEFFKMEKIELGGLKGRNLSRGIQEIYNEFRNIYIKWSNFPFDALDPTPTVDYFEKERREFQEAAEVLERKLAAILVQAFDECFTMESLVKLIEVCGSILQRPIIFKEIKDKMENMLELYNQDLDIVKTIFDEGVETINKSGIDALVVDKGFPPVTGALTWIRKMKARITKPTEELPNIEFKEIFETEDGRFTMERKKEMCDTLAALETEIFERWKLKVPAEISFNMGKFLLRTTDEGFLELNFDAALVAALKEVRLLKTMDNWEIPEAALELFGMANELWVSWVEGFTQKSFLIPFISFQNARVMLSRIVEWYNEIKERTVACEFDIIRKYIVLIDNKLEIALNTATWRDYNQDYITDVYSDLRNLHTRIMQTKENIEAILSSLRQWGSQPMYVRHDNISSNLMVADDFPGMIYQRQLDCQESKKLIDHLVDENFRLFFNLTLKPPMKKDELPAKRSFLESIDTLKSIEELDVSEDHPSETDVGEMDKAAQASDSPRHTQSLKTPSTSKSSLSEFSYDIEKSPSQVVLFRPYEEYIDSVIWLEIQEALRISIKYLKFEMEDRLERNAPMFEVKLDLQSTEIVFVPPMTSKVDGISMSSREAGGLLDIITSMIEHILNISEMIPLVAQPQETFLSVLDKSEGHETREIAEIFDMQHDIISLTRDTISEAVNFAKKFEKYNFIWLTDKKLYLQHFLRFGRILTSEESEKVEEGTLELPESKPDLEKFKQVIDFYGELHEEVLRNDTTHVFNSWLKVNMKGLKYSLLNEICKWSLMFKENLKATVLNDLNKLEEFIDASTASLKQEATNEDSPTLLKILKTIGSIKDREQQIDTMFEPLKEIVDLLKSYDMSFDHEVNNQFAELPEQWITLKKLAIAVKQNTAPVQAYQVDLIRKRIMLFDLRTRLYHENFLKQPFFSVPCPNVYELCDMVHEELSEMERQVAGFRDSAIHFYLNLPEEGRIIHCRKLIKMVKHIWDFLHAVSSCIDDWKMTPWKKIDVEDMEVECKRFSKEMRNFDKDMKTLRPYIETEAMIKNLLTSLRAITELQNPAIRERHWNELMVATKVSSNPRNRPSFSHNQNFHRTSSKSLFQHFVIGFPLTFKALQAQRISGLLIVVGVENLSVEQFSFLNYSFFSCLISFAQFLL